MLPLKLEVKAKVYGQFLDTEEVKEKNSPLECPEGIWLCRFFDFRSFIIRNIINVCINIHCVW